MSYIIRVDYTGLANQFHEKIWIHDEGFRQKCGDPYANRVSRVWSVNELRNSRHDIRESGRFLSKSVKGRKSPGRWLSNFNGRISTNRMRDGMRPIGTPLWSVRSPRKSENWSYRRGARRHLSVIKRGFILLTRCIECESPTRENCGN